MKDDKIETVILRGYAITVYMGALAFLLYACIVSGKPNGWWIALTLLIAMIGGLALFIFDKKKRKAENLGTRDLLQKSLEKLHIKFELSEKDDFIVRYQGETFIIQAEDDYQYIYIYDVHWYAIPIDDVKNFSVLRKAINLYNREASVAKMIYIIDQEEGKISVHTKSCLLWVSSVLGIEEDLENHLLYMLKGHQRLFQYMEKIRQEEYKSNG